jgi:hypothetical protein
VSLTRRRTGFAAALALAAGVATSAVAQVRQPGESLSVGDGSGPLSDVSTNVGHDSRPMHDGAQTLGETSGGPVHSGPISDWDTRSMLSGPVSSMSQGPMYRPQPSLSGGSMTEASAGAVKHDVASPLGTRISDPLHELGGLREQMRARRQQAELDALQRAAEPAQPAADAALLDAVAAEAVAIDAAEAEAAAADAAAGEAASADAASHEDGEAGDPAQPPAPGDGP